MPRAPSQTQKPITDCDNHKPQVLEVTAGAAAPGRTFQELLAAVPADISRDVQLAARREVAAAQAKVGLALITCVNDGALMWCWCARSAVVCLGRGARCTAIWAR